MNFAGYNATRADDGSLTIHAVPIFVECEKNGTNFDAQWITTAVARARQAEGEGYLPPLHVRHHGDDPAGGPVRPAGYFRIVGSEVITFKGSQRIAILADLVVTDPVVGEEVLSKRLPYRSVEIFDVERPNIDSLALLDHEAPYLELPMLMVSSVAEGNPAGVAYATFRTSWASATTEDSGEPLVCMQRGNHAFLFQHMNATEIQKPDEQQPEKAAAKPETPSLFEKEGEAPKKDDGEEMEGGEGGPDVKAICKAIESGDISVADMDAILEAIQKQRGAAEEEAPEEEPAPAMDPGTEAMRKDDTEDAAKFAALQGKIDALEARDQAREKAEQAKQDVAEALKRLEGRPLGSDPEAKLAAFRVEHGAEAFKAYVDSFAETFGRVPARESLSAPSSDAGVSPVVQAYQHLGSEAIEKAAYFSSVWQDLSKRGRTRRSEEKHVEVLMRQAGFSPKK